MSTEYYTEPPIKYEDFLLAQSVEIRESSKEHSPFYLTPHKVIFKDGSYIHVREDNGNARFERFGANSIWKVFPSIIEEFNVKIFDAYGLEYPECYD